MSELKCPKCGYPTNFHGDSADDSWLRLLSGNSNAHCELMEVQAVEAAQRAHALAHMRGIAIRARECAGPDGRLMSDDVAELWIAADAYRAIGVLRKPKP